MRGYGFLDSVAKAEVAEEVAAAFYESKGCYVEDVRRDKEWRKADVDFLVNCDMQVEVKSDSYTTGNLWAEVVANSTKGTPGCFLSSEADFWFYYFTRWDTAVILPMRNVRAWLREHMGGLREARTSTFGGGKKLYESVGRLVPVRRLLEEVPSVVVCRGVRASLGTGVS